MTSLKLKVNSFDHSVGNFIGLFHLVRSVIMELEVEEIRVIELHMMDKKKYYPLTMMSGLTIRGILYPLTLIRTRLQVQDGRSVYNGTFDAFIKIVRNEGFSGLYRGIGVSCFQIFPSLLYITIYENMRLQLIEKTSIQDSLQRSLVAGCTASCVSQSLVVPLDIVSQHMMLLGQRKPHENESKKVKVEKNVQTLQRLNISEDVKHKRFGAVNAIIRQVYQRNGFGGFYKGFGASLAVFMPSSGAWWFFYDLYGSKYFFFFFYFLICDIFIEICTFVS